MVLIDIEMPKNCLVCPIKAWEEGENYYVCPITGIMCLNIGRQNDCPLMEVEDAM